MRSLKWTIALPHAPKGMEDVPRQIQGEGPNWTRHDIQDALRAVRKSGDLVCLCRTDNSKESRSLHSRMMPVQQKLTIARNPDTGPDHDPGCYFFQERPNDSGRQAYVDGVIAEDPDGTIKLRLSTTLRPPQKGEPRGEALVRPERGRSRSQRAMTQRGFMDFLFDRTGTNLWRPAFAGHREPLAVLTRIRSEVAHIRSARIDIASRFGVCWPIPNRNYPFKSWAFKAKDGGFRGLVLAVVSSLNVESHRITLEHEEDAQLSLVFDDVAWAHLIRSFPLERSLIGNDAARVFGLFTCDFRFGARYPDTSVAGDVVDAALMAAEASSCIPVASGYELRMARALIDAQRSFRKPLRFDASEDLVFPDFVLIDRPLDIAVEVWGRDDNKYTARKAEKRAYYADAYPGRLIEWDAFRDDPLPPL